MVVQFEGIVPEAAPRVAYAPVDLDGQVGVVVVVPPAVNEIVRLDIIPLVRKHMISVLASETVRPNAAHTDLLG